MDEYCKADILNNIPANSESLRPRTEVGDSIKCNYEVYYGNVHTGRIKLMMIQRHSQLPSVPSKRAQGNLRRSKLKTESDY